MQKRATMPARSRITAALPPVLGLCLALSSCDSDDNVGGGDIEKVLFDQGQLGVFLKIDGSLLIEYYDSGGALVFRTEAVPDGTSQPLYDNAGASVALTEFDEVYYVEPIPGGARTQVVNPDGIMAEDEEISGVHDYKVEFIDQSTGQAEYTVDLVDISGTWYAEFAAPINEQITATVASDLFGNLTYIVSYDNAIGVGEFQVHTDTAGALIGTEWL
jgi:hypothetical protein